MMAWRSVGAQVVYAIHDRQLAEHGGLGGLQDIGPIESSLARPQNLAAHGAPGAADLASACAYGLVRNHGLSDGKKRTAWVFVRVFLAEHGCRLAFDPAEAARTMEAVAGGVLEEDELAAWFRARIIVR